jgi:hypothetical protein
MLRAYVLEYQGSWDKNLLWAKFSYNNSYQESLKMALFEVLYGRRCHTPLNWIEPGENVIFGPNLVEEAKATEEPFSIFTSPHNHAILPFALLDPTSPAARLTIEQHHCPLPSPSEWRNRSAIVPLSRCTQLEPKFPTSNAGSRRSPHHRLLPRGLLLTTFSILLWAIREYRKLRCRPLLLCEPKLYSSNHPSVPSSTTSPPIIFLTTARPPW